MIHIEPPPDFRDARGLPRRFDSYDPRGSRLAGEPVIVDLRSAEFVRPAAVLWCVVYPLLVKAAGTECKLLVPANFGVCVYLKSLGLFSLLREAGVEVDDRDIPEAPSRQVILPVRRFDTESEAEQLANAALENLRQLGVGSANTYPVISEIFGELAVNATQHADSAIGAYGLIQFYAFKGGEQFVACVADGGIGVRESLSRNPDLRGRFHYDWDALELAVTERVSGTGGSTRGFGLFGVAEDVRSRGGYFILHSGQGALSVLHGSPAKRQPLFPGTLAYVSVPT